MDCLSGQLQCILNLISNFPQYSDLADSVFIDRYSCLLSTLYAYSPLAGLSVVPNFIPPSEVRSSKPAVTGSPFRYNLNTGAAFNISCLINHTSDAFTGYFYKDGVVISDGDLVNTTLTETVLSATQKSVQLQFLNFQPVHDGVYHCFANTSDTNEEVSSDLYLYGSGEDFMSA